MAEAKSKTVHGVPEDAIAQLQTKYNEVLLKIKRRQSNGRISTLGDTVMPPVDVLNIESFCAKNGGGGRYEIEVRNPQNPVEHLVPKFMIELEGAPFPWRLAPGPAPIAKSEGEEMAYPPQYYVHPVGGPPRAMSPEQAQHYGYQPVGPAPGATVASDQMAMKHNAELKAAIAKLEAQAEEAKRREERLRDEMRKRDEELREERHRAELRLMEQRLEMLAKQKETPVALPQNNLEHWGPILAAIAPVLGTVFAANKESATEGLKLQQQGLTQLMQATLTQAGKPDSTTQLINQIMKIAPLAMPFVQKFLEDRSPAAMAELQIAQQGAHLDAISMMAQLIASTAAEQDPPPPWLGMVQNVLGNIVQTAEAHLESQKRARQPQQSLPMSQPQLAQPVHATQPQAAPQAPQTNGTPLPDLGQPPLYATIEDEPEVTAEAHAAQDVENAVAAGNLTVKESLMLSLLPADFQTDEWKTIVIGLHRATPEDTMASQLAGHIEALLDAGKEAGNELQYLPDAMQTILVDPQTTLQTCLEPLPIFKSDPQYAARVLVRTVEMLIEDGFYKPSPTPDVFNQDGTMAATAAQ